MTEIGRGFRGKIDDYFNISEQITVSISMMGSGNYDSCCFGVDSLDKLSDENYMVFYNQTSSPNKEIVLFTPLPILGALRQAAHGPRVTIE